MTRVLLLLLLFALPQILRSQNSLPSVNLKTIDGEEVRLSDYAALKKPLIISFWATYCGPCLVEFERVTNLYDQWKKEVDFEFIAVSIDEAGSASKIKSMAEGKKWPFIMLIDETRDVKRAMNVSDIPFCLIINREGVSVYKHEGYLPGDEINLLKELKKISNK